LTRARIATRKSPLALWQARHVADLLRARHPGIEVSFLEMTTEGDRFLGAPLSQVGGKGLFVKEIEQALLDSRADLAVHSLKDMTSQLPAGLCLAAVPPREDPRDAWVSRTGRKLRDLPAGGRVGTSSLRRSCQLLERWPELEVVTVRGNVQTRLRKMDEMQLEGVVLALAGLRRLGLEERVTEVLEPEVSLPAVGQGVLAIECRSDDAALLSLLVPLEDATTRAAITAERAFLARLEGGCTVPLAGHAQLEGQQVRLRGMVGRPDGKRVVRGERRAIVTAAEQMGRELAEELLERGGAEILAAFARTPAVPES
jgi:hydroxymethylbilane synthase